MLARLGGGETHDTGPRDGEPGGFCDLIVAKVIWPLESPEEPALVWTPGPEAPAAGSRWSPWQPCPRAAPSPLSLGVASWFFFCEICLILVLFFRNRYLDWHTIVKCFR